MTHISRRSFLASVALGTLASVIMAGCGSSASAATEVRSTQPRQNGQNVPQSNIKAVADSTNAFALDLYGSLRARSGNLFFSPYSIAQVLTMASAGAHGQTAQQMASTLHHTLPQDQLHSAENALNLALIGRSGTADEKGQNFTLSIVDDLWGQTGYQFRPEFLNVLAENYGAGLRLLDFKSASEAARATINARINDTTHGKIKDLIPPGSLDASTRLVLTNAIYFNAKWISPFPKEATHDQTFNPLNGSALKVPMMSQQADLAYADGNGYQAVSLPYQGDVSMVVLLPAAGQFATFESGLNATRLSAILPSLTNRQVILTMPKFDYRAESFSLKQTLVKLGMTDAFIPDKADFSGMDGTRNLFISDGFHQATVTVDEAGTEAAAATSTQMSATSAHVDPVPPVRLTIDRPFIFLIRDDATGTILFVGRIVAL